MPGLSRDLVEHRLPIKAGFRPYKQPVRHFNPIIYDRMKAEINSLLDAGFIRSCRYAYWISNIAPVEKKDSGKIRVCIDFRDLNKATPKYEYPMPIADMFIFLQLKDEAEFTWGAEQQEAFEKIKMYLSSPPVLKTPK